MTMARRSSKPEPAADDLLVTPEAAKVEAKGLEPVNIEQETPSEEPVPAADAPAFEKIQPDVRE